MKSAVQDDYRKTVSNSRAVCISLLCCIDKRSLYSMIHTVGIASLAAIRIPMFMD